LRCRRTSHRSTGNGGRLSWTQLNVSALTSRDPKAARYQSFLKQPRPQLAPQRTALPWGFVPLQRLKAKAATNTGISNPSCAAPSGFLNLLTRCSAFALLALFHARSALGVETLRGFPLPVAATAFTARCPSSSKVTSIRDEAWAPLRRTTRQQRPRERHLGIAPKNDASTSPRISQPPPPEEGDR
jgi:hypothetical protein